jgi:Rieske Fe-S protein
MNRKSFLRTCGVACAGGGFLPALLSGCSGGAVATGTLTGKDLVISLSEFEARSTGSSLIVYHERLHYPVGVFRHPDGHFSAVWMSCTHQGTELQVFGDHLSCPAHGSEFTGDGEVKNGPAAKPLRTFAVRIEQGNLCITLR